MGIEALLHSTIHGRHGKNTGNSQNAGGESLAGGFAGLLQGHLSSPLGPSEATDGKSSPLMSDDASPPLLADTSLADPALLATITPTTGSAEPRPPSSSDRSAPAATAPAVPTTIGSGAAQGSTQDTLAAAASALDAITPRNATPIDQATENTTRMEQSNNAPPAPSALPAAAPTPVAERGRFTEQLARATTRTAAPTTTQGAIQMERQESKREQATKAESPATANTTTPAVSSGSTARSGEPTPLPTSLAARQQAPASLQQENTEKAPPTQRTAVSQAFTNDRHSLPTSTASAPTTLPAAPAEAASPVQTTADAAMRPPVSKQTAGISIDAERGPETATTTTPDLDITLPIPARPLQSAQANANAPLTRNIANAASENTTPDFSKAAPSSLPTAPTPAAVAAPSLPPNNETPAPAVVTAAVSNEPLSGRRPTPRNSAPETRATTASPLAAASDSNDAIVTMPQTAQPVRNSAAAKPISEASAQATPIAAATEAKPSGIDGSSAPADSAKLAAMPAVAANTAPPTGPAAGGEAGAAQHPETTLQLPTHLRDPRWGEQLGERVVVLAQGEKNSSAQIDINPAQLGPIRVKIDMNGDQVSVQFSSASSEVRQVLEDALPRLREQLANSGIQLGQANVGSQSQQTPREAFAQSTPSPRSPGEGAILPAESALETQSSGRLIQSGRGLVDLFA